MWDLMSTHSVRNRLALNNTPGLPRTIRYLGSLIPAISGSGTELPRRKRNLQEIPPGARVAQRTLGVL
jgi:hypothetical protein